MQTKIIERYFFFSLLIATFIFSILIFRPFWIVLVLGISFSIVLYPIYAWFNKIKFPSWLSALITVLLFIVVIGILLFGAGIVVFNQSQNVYTFISNNGNTLPFINSVNDHINKLLPGVSFDLHDKISSFISYITDNLAGVFTTTLSTLFAFFLTFLSMFYFLKDSTRWKKALIRLSPLSDEDNEKILEKISQTVNSIIKGNLFVVFLQGVLVCIGFVIFGVPNSALWGLVAMITSFIPTVGSGIVSVPAIIFLFAVGRPIEAIGLTLWAVAMVGTIGTLLNPIIVGNKINLHPILILFSVLGGISLLGPVGILVGPLTISFFYTLISIYRDKVKIEDNA